MYKHSNNAANIFLNRQDLLIYFQKTPPIRQNVSHLLRLYLILDFILSAMMINLKSRK